MSANIAFGTLAEAPPGGETSFLSQSVRIDTHESANWDTISDWLDRQTNAYCAAFARTNGLQE